MIKINLILFLEILSISMIFCGFCGINPPRSPSDCGNYLKLNRTHRCCYCKNIFTEKYYCLVSIYNETSKNIQAPEGFTLAYDCDLITENDDLPGAPCLNHSETENLTDFDKDYCHSLSIDEKHPCCYYDDGIDKRCFSVGKIDSDTLYTYTDYLDCFSSFQKIDLLLIIFVSIFCF